MSAEYRVVTSGATINTPLLAGEPQVQRRFRVENEGGEHTFHWTLVVEDFRLGIYLSVLVIFLVGLGITKGTGIEDYDAVIIDVFGFTNMCVYFDWPPATYVLPILWCFGIICAFFYVAASILRVKIAYLEKKLHVAECVFLVVSFFYILLSFMWFTQAFAVQPDRDEPNTLRIHTSSYVNLKLAVAHMQVCVVYFGVKVAWKGMALPRWWNGACIAHAAILMVVSVINVVILINALLDMGESQLVGKGAWWSVHSAGAKRFGVVMYFMANALALVLPALQAAFFAWKGVNSHALVIAIRDNRDAAQVQNDE